MPGENILDWSIIAVNNGTADTLINWAEGQPRASVNNSARSMMAAIAKNRDLLNGSIVTGGSANAQTFTTGMGFTILPVGIRVMLKIGPGLTNTAAVSLNMDGTGNGTIVDEAGVNVAAGALVAGQYVQFLFNGTNWVKLITGTQTFTTAPSGTSDTTVATTQYVINAITHTLALDGYNSSVLPGYTGVLKIGQVGGTGGGTDVGIAMRAQYADGWYILFANSTNGTIGSIRNNSHTSVTYNTTSDAALKTDIVDLPPVGNIIDALRPVRFKWKDHLDLGYQTGFIAQETQTVVPQAVTPGTDQIPWQMDFSKLIPLLVAEVRSLRTRVAELEAQ